VIAKGDTLAILAEIYYDSQTYADYLLQVNPGLDAKRLMVGSVILVPEKPGDMSVINPIDRPTPVERKAAAPATDTPPRASGETYTVKSGDSLWRIAKRELGDQSKWKQIYDLNKDRLKSPDQLKVGQVLRLPER
jgi:LysM repeat protein